MAGNAAIAEKTDTRRIGGFAGIAKRTLPSDKLTDTPVLALARFSRLVSRLEHETDRGGQLHMLKELAGISKEYYGHPRKSLGSTALADALGPISKFIRKNIRDAELVGGAIEVLTNTGTILEFMRELDRLGDIASRTRGANVSAQKLTEAYLEYATL